MQRCLLVAMLFLLPFLSWSQDSLSFYDKAYQFPDKAFSFINKKNERFQRHLAQTTDKYLRKLKKQEAKLYRIAALKDTTTAKELFTNPSRGCSQLLQDSTDTGEVYNAHLDSMQTALRFFQLHTEKFSPGDISKMKSALGQYQHVQAKLNQAGLIEAQLKSRQQLIKERLGQLGMTKEFKRYQQQLYYYRSQMDEYKDIFETPGRLESTFLKVANKFPGFVKFFNSHSALASLFHLPGNDDLTSAATNGLQTRSMVVQELQQRLGAGPNVQQMVNNSMNGAQQQLDKIKDKLQQYGRSGADVDMPDFKPNTPKSKSFLKRLELGANLQSVKSNSFLPVTSDVGLSLGYKISPGATAGVGMSYKMGWGRDFRHLSFTHEGLGFRSFAEYKLKNSLWLSGGTEVNYFSSFKSIDQLKNYSGWQKSALLGISKKYQVTKRYKGDIKLLYDFLWREQVPQGKAFLLRTGYNF